MSFDVIVRPAALGIKFQNMVDLGKVRVRSGLARLGFITRAWLTRTMNLILLAPDNQACWFSLKWREGILRW